MARQHEDSFRPIPACGVPHQRTHHSMLAIAIPVFVTVAGTSSKSAARPGTVRGQKGASVHSG
jgi:hypothetical protein